MLKNKILKFNVFIIVRVTYSYFQLQLYILLPNICFLCMKVVCTRKYQDIFLVKFQL